MNVTLLLEFGFGLVLILGLLIFFLLSSKRKKELIHKNEVQHKPVKQAEEKVDLKSLKAIIEHKKTTAKELEEALALVLKEYGVIHNTSRNYLDIMEILFTICIHPNTNKNIIINFDKELTKLNPEYKSEISDAIKRGLDSRGA